MSQNVNVLITGVFAAGKSTLIKRFIPDCEIDIHKTTKGPLAKRDYVTVSINEYQCGNHTLIDTPGLYTEHVNTHLKSCEFLERVLIKIKYLHYVILVLPATEFGIRKIDLEMLRVLLEFKHLMNKIVIYISKTDLLDEDQLATFMNEYKNVNILAKFPTYIPNMNVKEGRVYTSPNRADITELNYQILGIMLQNLHYRPVRHEQSELNTHINIPIIKQIQQHMINLNLYSPNYAEYSSGKKKLWITKLIYGDGVENKNSYIPYKKFVSTNIVVKVVNIDNVTISNQIIYDTIYYESGKKFYEGTLYGNVFNVGTFYKETGEVFYEKDV